MSHPKDRRERFLIGDAKGKRRAEGYWGEASFSGTPEEQEEFARMAVCRRRDTTKLCSCSMCGNPRRKEFRTSARLTMQEKKFEEMVKTDL